MHVFCACRLRRFASVERAHRAVVDEIENGFLIEEFDHRFGRMDIDVHHVAGEVDKQHAAGEFSLHDAVGIGLLQRGGEKL